jgi:hypothetical protein
MKNALFAAAFGAALLSSSAAFADRWVEPINGTVSAIMVPDGDVMMKIVVPAKEYTAITGMLAKQENTCTLFHTTQGGDALSVVLVCGARRELVPNY